MTSSVLVIDNGAWELKAGLASMRSPALAWPNCTVKRTTGGVKRLLVGDETREAREAATVYRRAHERGYVVDWTTQKRVWDRVLGPDGLALEPSAHELLCLVPPALPRRLLEDLAQMAFEEYGFAALFAPTAAAMMAWDPAVGAGAADRACVVVDAGYSHTHVVPCWQGYPVLHATGRLDVGGKALTNYLKELISYRQWNMMDETWLVNHIKERLCFVASDFEAELRAHAASTPQNPHSTARDFVLPDYVTSRTGWVRGEDAPPPPPADGPAPPEQLLRMGLERVAVPECLLRPSDMGLAQMGLAEGVLHCAARVAPPLRPQLSRLVLLGGGCAQLPGLADRLEADLRAALPEDEPLRVVCPAQPQYSAWRGAARFTREPHYAQMRVSATDYAEWGVELCASKFVLF